MTQKGYIFDATILKVEGTTPSLVARIATPLIEADVLSDSFTAKALVQGTANEVFRRCYDNETNHEIAKVSLGQELPVKAVSSLLLDLINKLKEHPPKGIKVSTTNNEKFQLVSVYIEKEN